MSGLRVPGNTMSRAAMVSAREGWRTAFAPATIANFGSGFDAFAAALIEVVPSSPEEGEFRVLGDRVSVRRTKSRGVKVIEITGDGGKLPCGASKNCASVAAAAVLRSARAPFGLDLILEKGLPLSSGLGSSAASAAAGAFAAALACEGLVEWGSFPGTSRAEASASEPEISINLARRPEAGRKVEPDGIERAGGPGHGVVSTNRGEMRGAPVSEAIGEKSVLLAPALAGEHVADGSWHGDNVFASLLGGGVIVLSTRACEILRIESPASLRWVVVHPEFELTTRRARAVLPKRVPLADAAAQAACFASMIAAWSRGDRVGIGRGLEDRLAEPRRARLIPGYAAVRRAAIRAGAHGLTLAGAGPSVLAVTPAGEEEKVGEAIHKSFARAGLDSTAHVCAVDAAGAREVPE